MQGEEEEFPHLAQKGVQEKSDGRRRYGESELIASVSSDIWR